MKRTFSPQLQIRTLLTGLPPLFATGSGVLIGIASGAAICQAAPNGYTQIPIAKVFGDGVAAFSFSAQQFGSYGAFYTTQYGIFNRTEVGLDYQAAPESERSALGNVKYLLAHHPGHIPDIACGITNIASGQRAVPYAVATTQPGLFGGSLGLTRPSVGGVVGMGGVAYNLSPSIQFVSDYVGGRGSYGTLGVIAAATPNISVNLAYARPNSSDYRDTHNPQGYVFNVSYVFHLKGGGGGGSPQPKNPAAGGS